MIPHIFKISLKDDPTNPSSKEEIPEAYYFVYEYLDNGEGGYDTNVAVKADSELPADVKAKLDACFQDPVVAGYLAGLTPNT